METKDNLNTRLAVINLDKAALEERLAVITPQIVFEDVRIKTGDTYADFPISLSAPAVNTVVINYLTINDTARSGHNFVMTQGQVVFGLGETLKLVRVPLVNHEAGKRFGLYSRDSVPLGATILRGKGFAYFNTAARSEWVPAQYQQTFFSRLLEPINDTGFVGEGYANPCWRSRLFWGRKHPSELGVATDPALHGTNPFPIVDGIRCLQAEKLATPIEGSSWSSALMTTLNLYSFTYGYVEARMKLPSVSGCWPAFWLLPMPYGWPPEIDVIEAHGWPSADARAGPYAYHVAQHWNAANNQLGGWMDTHRVKADITPLTDWHVYGIEWTKELIRYYMDGVEMFAQPNNFFLPAYLIFDLAVGGWAGPPNESLFPASMAVDWVAVYQKAY